MRSRAFLKAEHARLSRRRATLQQRHHIAGLAADLGMEVPHIFWATDAEAIIGRLEALRRQPSLDGFSDALQGGER